MSSRIVLEERNKWLLYTLNILLIIVAISVWINGFSPCDKCKLKIYPAPALNNQEPVLMKEMTCKEALEYYAYDTYGEILNATKVNPYGKELNITLEKN